MPMKRFNIWLDTELIKRTKKAGEAIGVSKTAYMRMAIMEKLKTDGYGDKSKTGGDILDR